MGLAAARWGVAPRRSSRVPAVPGPATRPDTLRAPESTATVAQAKRPPTPRATAPRESPRALPSATPAARQEDSVMQSLRATPLAAMRRPLDPGATPAA